MALMIRQIIQAEENPTLIDDRDFYGNKRLELAGSLMSLLFESLFKQLNSDLKAIVEKKAYVDIIKHIFPRIITVGLENALATVSFFCKLNLFFC